MSKKWTHTAAFQFYGTEPRNPMWSWSARSEDRKTVVVTLWKDELIGRAGQMVCARSDRGDWHDGPGYRFFMEDLAWAQDNCDGLVRVIVATPRIEDGQRRIDECYPQQNLFMRVTAADPAKGAFTSNRWSGHEKKHDERQDSIEGLRHRTTTRRQRLREDFVNGRLRRSHREVAADLIVEASRGDPQSRPYSTTR